MGEKIDKALEYAFQVPRFLATLFSLVRSHEQREKQRHSGKVGEEYSALYATLSRDLNNAWSALAMWGCVIPQNDEAKKRIARMVWKRYLREGTAIMRYLAPQGSVWDSSEEDAFRRELNEIAEHLGIEKEE